MIIIGVDPGKTVGVAVIAIGDVDARYYDSAQMTTENALTWIKKFVEICANEDIVIACERFVIGMRTAKMSRQADAPMIIGVLQAYCVSQNIRFVENTASEAKGFATDAVLRKMRLYRVGKDHANDAMRHALLQLLASHPDEVELLLAGGMFLSDQILSI